MKARPLACLFVFGILTVPCAMARDSCTWNGSTGDWNTGAAWSCGHAPGPADNVVINSGTVTLGSTATISGYSQTGGELTGAGDLTVSGTMGWSGGTISGSGSLTTQGTATFEWPVLIDRAWTLEGGGTWVDGHADLTDSATLVVPSGQTLAITGNGAQLRNVGTPPGGAQFVVDGSITYTRASGSVNIDVTTENTGTITAIAGVLRFRGSLQNDGRVQASRRSISPRQISSTTGPSLRDCLRAFSRSSATTRTPSSRSNWPTRATTTSCRSWGR